MANGNGNGNGMMIKVLLALSLLALGTIGTLVTFGAAGVNDSMKTINAAIEHTDVQIDKVEEKQVAYDKQQARVAITLDQIASALQVPSAIDTAAALRVLQDTTLTEPLK